MSLEEQRGEIIAELKVLNTAVKTQNSVGHIFMTGVIYGVGFVVGSAILATIAIGIFGPTIADIPWVRDTFKTGADFIRE
jgi:threonine/homoserine/homoserine lactone efflux protein